MQNDVINVGCGCLHWVYARGTSVNSAWNFGDFSADQIRHAFERWSLNQEIGFASLVPMQTLTADIVDDAELLKLPSNSRLELALLLRERLTEALNREEVRVPPV